MSRQLEMLDKPRRKPVVRMHVSDVADSGCVGGSHLATFKCAKCGHETEWIKIRNVSEGKRGKPCPNCNT